MLKIPNVTRIYYRHFGMSAFRDSGVREEGYFVCLHSLSNEDFLLFYSRISFFNPKLKALDKEHK